MSFNRHFLSTTFNMLNGERRNFKQFSMAPKTTPRSWVEKTRHHGIYLTNFEGFGNQMKQSFKGLIYSFKSLISFYLPKNTSENDRYGNAFLIVSFLLQWCFITATLLVICAGVWFYFIIKSNKVMIYPAVIVLGFGFSTMLVNSLSFTTELIGEHKVSLIT